MPDIVHIDTLGRVYRSRAGRKPKSIQEKLWSKLDKLGPEHPKRPELGKCWMWTEHVGPTGYPYVWHEGRYWRAHRLVYRLKVGPLDPALTIDHTCTRKTCLNPRHLEQITSGDNTRRAIADGLRKPGPYSKEVMS